MPRHRDNPEIDPNLRHLPDIADPPKPPPREPPVKDIGDAALRGAGVVSPGARKQPAAQQPPRTPPPQRQAPEQRDRVDRDVGRTALRDTVQPAPDRER
jgi:hypothetical protein